MCHNYDDAAATDPFWDSLQHFLIPRCLMPRKGNNCLTAQVAKDSFLILSNFRIQKVNFSIFQIKRKCPDINQLS